MRHLATILCLLHLACAVTSVSTDESASLVDDAITECNELCVVQWYLGCANTVTAEWFAGCINHCHDTVAAYWPIGGLSCMGAIATWQECQQGADWTCWNGWPATPTEQCGWQRSQFEYQCIRDPMPPEGL